MALPLLVGLGIQTVARYTMKYGIPAAKEAYKAYLKKNPAMKKKMKETMTDFFKKDSIVSAGTKFANKNIKKTTKTRKTNTPRTSKKTTKKTETQTERMDRLSKETGTGQKFGAKKLRDSKAGQKAGRLSQAETNKRVRGAVGKVVGVGTAGALVYEAAKGIRASSEAKADAARKRKEKAAADKRKAKKKTETKKDSTPSRRIDNTADYSRASSDYRSRGTSPKRDKPVARPSSFQDIDAKEKKKKDTGGVKTRFGGRVKTRSGSLRARGN